MQRFPGVVLVGMCALFLYALFLAGTFVAGSQLYRLDDACEINGFIGQSEHFVLQGRFWRAQEGMIDQQITTLQNAAGERADLRRQVAETKKQASAMLSGLPAPSPTSPALEQAKNLRAEADTLEAAQREIWQRQQDAEKIGSLQACKAKVHQRAQGSIW